MKQKSFYTKSILVFAISLIFVLSGCEDAKETVEDTPNKAKKNTSELVKKKKENLQKPNKKTLKEISEQETNFVEDKFLVGEWSGSFDIRTAVLKITEQKGNDFTGKIQINLRKKINQDIVGSYKV